MLHQGDDTVQQQRCLSDLGHTSSILYASVPKDCSVFQSKVCSIRSVHAVTQCHTGAPQAAYGFRFLLGLTLAGRRDNGEALTGRPDSDLAATPTTPVSAASKNTMSCFVAVHLQACLSVGVFSYRAVKTSDSLKRVSVAIDCLKSYLMQSQQASNRTLIKAEKGVRYMCSLCTWVW